MSTDDAVIVIGGRPAPARRGWSARRARRARWHRASWSTGRVSGTSRAREAHRSLSARADRQTVVFAEPV
jgi:hypothetical protein